MTSLENCAIVNNKSSESCGWVVTRWTIIEISGFDSDRSDLSSNLMQVYTFFLTLLLFAINKAYF